MNKIRLYIDFYDEDLETIEQVYLDKEFDTLLEANLYEKRLNELFSRRKYWTIGKSIPVVDNRRFVVRLKEDGTELVRSRTAQGANTYIEQFEDEDRQDGTYIDNRYEVYDTKDNTII